MDSRQERDQQCRSAPVGKLMPDALYVHRSALVTLPLALRRECEEAERMCRLTWTPDVFKISRNRKRVTLLSYPEFAEHAHPALEAYAVVESGKTTRLVNCAGRANPPILHRKELFVSVDHPQYPEFAQLTQEEERHGLYRHPSRIGTRQGWEAELHAAGFEIHGHELCARRSPLPQRGMMLDG